MLEKGTGTEIPMPEKGTAADALYQSSYLDRRKRSNGEGEGNRRRLIWTAGKRYSMLKLRVGKTCFGSIDKEKKRKGWEEEKN